jgi:hypothetical protein
MAATLLGSTREKLRAFLGAWVVIWIAAVVGLLVFWRDLPIWVSWPLAMLEAILVPDFSVLKRHAFKREKANQTNEV